MTYSGRSPGHYPTDRMINQYALTHNLFIHIDRDMTPIIGRGHSCVTVLFHKLHTTEERQGMIDYLQEDCYAHLADIYGVPAVEFCNRDVWPGK